jgi:hypothetical protein
LNSASERFTPAKVIVPPAVESNRTVPVPAFHPAESVEAFVHVPLTVQVSLPKEMADAAEEILTAPVMVTFPLVDVRSPPLIVRPPLTVSVFVPFARIPPLRVKVEAVSWLNCVLVPPLISREAKD